MTAIKSIKIAKNFTELWFEGKRKKTKRPLGTTDRRSNGTRRSVRQVASRHLSSANPRRHLHSKIGVDQDVTRPERAVRRCGDDGKWRGKLGTCKGQHSLVILNWIWFGLVWANSFSSELSWMKSLNSVHFDYDSSPWCSSILCHNESVDGFK